MADLSSLRIPEALGSIKEVWPSEAGDFTPWLSQNLRVLDVLGLGRLELMEREKTVPGTLRSLDLLARSPSGELVAVENQFGAIDHDHLTRGLAYAIGLQAETLVVIAEDHRDEFRAVAHYLNEVAGRSEYESRVGVYLVTVGVESVEQFYLPRFNVVEAPNSWTESIGPPPPSRLPDVETFLEKADPSVRKELAKLCIYWTNSGGTVRLGTRSVSLDRPHPFKNIPLSHFVAYTDGSVWLNRGYLVPVIGDQVEQFDAVVAKALPSLKWGEKRYYLISPTPIDLDGTRAVVDWLEKLQEPSMTS
ncbi:MAG: hypothetical protein ACYDEY_00320 [Acidimicrobiales bacterium]